MGAFNTFVTEERCPGCDLVIERGYQFKFSNKWQNIYRSGDQLEWGGNDEGDPGQPLVLVDCVPESCRSCGFDYDWSDGRGFRLRVENDRFVGVEGPLEFDSLVFGSHLDLRTTKTQLEAHREDLGLWTTWEGDETYSVETHSNFGEWFWLEPNAHGARQYNQVDWAGPAFLRVIHVTRRDELVEIVSSVGLELLTPGPPRHRSYTRPDDHVFYVDSEAELTDTSIYRGIANATGRRVLIYDEGGELPVYEFDPGGS